MTPLIGYATLSHSNLLLLLETLSSIYSRVTFGDRVGTACIPDFTVTRVSPSPRKRHPPDPSELFRCHLSVLLTGEIARLEDRDVKALAARGAKVARLEVDATLSCLIALR